MGCIRPFSCFLVLLVGALFVLSPAAAQNQYFKTKADFALIMDYESGEVLYDKQARVPMMPASMSKLMTTAIVLDQIKSGKISLETEFEVSEKAWRTKGSKMFVLVKT
ncbi:MAG: D-alanyl-D-alanine carboxypeptidase, partial [Parvularculaceae bacterium]